MITSMMVIKSRSIESEPGGRVYGIEQGGVHRQHGTRVPNDHVVTGSALQGVGH